MSGKDIRIVLYNGVFCQKQKDLLLKLYLFNRLCKKTQSHNILS